MNNKLNRLNDKTSLISRINQRGLGLIEAIVSLGIFGVSVVGMMATTRMVVSVEQSLKADLDAEFLASYVTELTKLRTSCTAALSQQPIDSEVTFQLPNDVALNSSNSKRYQNVVVDRMYLQNMMSTPSGEAIAELQMTLTSFKGNLTFSASYQIPMVVQLAGGNVGACWVLPELSSMAYRTRRYRANDHRMDGGYTRYSEAEMFCDAFFGFDQWEASGKGGCRISGPDNECPAGEHINGFDEQSKSVCVTTKFECPQGYAAHFDVDGRWVCRRFKPD